MNERDRRIVIREARQDDGYVERLVFIYGAERAAAILEGRDARANNDLVAWRGLGQPSAKRAAR